MNYKRYLDEFDALLNEIVEEQEEAILIASHALKNLKEMNDKKIKEAKRILKEMDENEELI